MEKVTLSEAQPGKTYVVKEIRDEAGSLTLLFLSL